MSDKTENDAYSDAEAEQRFKTTLKRMLSTPHRLHSDSKKPRTKKAKKSVRAKPRSRGA
ncbi:MAG TPA: hypothetical protein VEU06_05160 [Micropepsaceae bacterium]|nr:hypothetical protein [Micropepsaceae bacterium]